MNEDGSLKDQGGYSPEGPATSKLRFYSLGVAADNKALGSMVVEVTPMEELSMLDGEITSSTKDYKASASNALGASYDNTVQSQVTVPATWLRFGDSTRMTAPDVRRGDPVLLFQYGDANKYYWMSIKPDSALRRLETVVHAISASRKEGDPMDADHSYYVEWSTHKKLLHIHTSQADGEPFGYDIQINAKDGAVVILDTIGQYFSFDSAARRFEMKNADGSHFDMDKTNLTMTTTDSIVCKTKHFQVDAATATLNAMTDVTKTLSVALMSSLNGGLDAQDTTGGGPITGTARNRIRGGLVVEGVTSFAGNVNIATNLLVQGFATLQGGYS